MAVVRPRTAEAFLELADPLLERDEARHNLIYGIAATVIAQPAAHQDVRLWVGVRGGRPVAAALRTPPHNLVIADPVDGDALEELVGAVVGDGIDLPGLVGNRPFADIAADLLAAARGVRAEVAISQAAHSLSAVEDVPRSPGTARPASSDDRPLLLEWFIAFSREALPPREGNDEQMERSLDARLSGTGSGLWLWEDAGRPVSLAGFLGRTPNGIRVGPVYTPPERRRSGYATSLVADLSRWLLDQGNRFCFLYTDLANPTSNAIYARIGYRRICDAVEYRFATETR